MAPKKKAGGGGSGGGGPSPMVLGAAGIALAAVAYFALSGSGAKEAAPPPADEEAAPAEEAEDKSVAAVLSVEDDLARLNSEVWSSSGGEPWLIWCSDSATAGADGTAPADIISELAPLLEGTARVGSLDCTSKLPSGKSVYTKLGLDAAQAPVMFVSPKQGKKPQQL